MEKGWPQLEECPQYKRGMIDLYMRKFNWEDNFYQTKDEIKYCGDIQKFLDQVRYSRGYEVDEFDVPNHLASPFIPVQSIKPLNNDKHYVRVMDYVKEIIIEYMNSKTRKVYKYVDTVNVVGSKKRILLLTFTAKENANEAEEQTYYAAINAPYPKLKEFEILECFLKPDCPAPGYPQPPQGFDMENGWPPLKESRLYQCGMIYRYMEKLPWEEYLNQIKEEIVHYGDQNKQSYKPSDIKKFLDQVRYSRGYEVEDCVLPRFVGSPFRPVDSSELLGEVYAPVMNYVKEIIIKHMNTQTGKVYKYVDTVKLVDTIHRTYLLTFTAKEDDNDAEEQTYYAAIYTPRHNREEFKIRECFLKPDGPAPGYPQLPEDLCPGRRKKRKRKGRGKEKNRGGSSTRRVRR